jgi:hypothetical protein
MRPNAARPNRRPPRRLAAYSRAPSGRVPAKGPSLLDACPSREQGGHLRLRERHALDGLAR